LKAYSVHNTTDGYCQAQAPIAAVLLMHMPAEHAFWCLVSICEKYLPGYYSAGLVSCTLPDISGHTFEPKVVYVYVQGGPKTDCFVGVVKIYAN